MEGTIWLGSHNQVRQCLLQYLLIQPSGTLQKDVEKGLAPKALGKIQDRTSSCTLWVRRISREIAGWIFTANAFEPNHSHVSYYIYNTSILAENLKLQMQFGKNILHWQFHLCDLLGTSSALLRRSWFTTIVQCTTCWAVPYIPYAGDTKPHRSLVYTWKHYVRSSQK